MIGRDDYRPAFGKRCLDYAPQALIDSLYWSYGRTKIARVSDHIRVRVIHDHSIKTPAGNLVNDFIGDTKRAHFRLEIVGRNLRRGDQDALLAWKLRLDASVEEERDMRILFGLSYPQIL